ncbi:unnamed protein product [Phytophthora fragariaefolia]|uniref:Unnamed protein product n=1 Tax=Phytophthora fragariaefolia TaxID=1490495 RepID=A0A9W7D4Y4_9STRA|nr:unnamed protein product [Phytophthora fragariaefolia]
MGLEATATEADGRTKGEDAEAAEEQLRCTTDLTRGPSPNERRRASAANVASAVTGGDNAPCASPPLVRKRHPDHQQQLPQQAEEAPQQTQQQLWRREMGHDSRGGDSTVAGPLPPRPGHQPHQLDCQAKKQAGSEASATSRS